MEKREALAKRLLSLAPDIKAEDLIIPLPFNLPPDSSSEPVDGIVAVLVDRIVVYTDGEKTGEFERSNISEFKCMPGVGCTFIECIYEGSPWLICRADMSYNRLYAPATKRLNRLLENPEIGYSYDYEEDIERSCPKCGRPYQPGSGFCTTCVSKGKYLKRLWEMAYPYRFYIYVSVALYFIITACSMITPYINRVLVDQYIQPKNSDLVGFLVVIASMFGVNIFVRLISTLRSLTLIRAGSKVIVKLREMVFEKIQQLSLSRISKRTSGELMNRVTNDTSTLQNFITWDLGNIIEQVLIVLSIGIFLFVYNWRLALLIVLPMPLVSIANRLLWRKLRSMYHRQWTYNAKSSTILHDIFSGIRVVKAFGMERWETDRYDKVTYEECKIQQRNERYYSIISPLINLINGYG